MMTRFRFKVAGYFFVCIGAVAFAAGQKEQGPGEEFSKRSEKIGLSFVADVSLEGGSSRFDYQSIDESKRRLYIAHLGANLVTVVDVDSRTVVANIPGIPEPHGILAVPELNQVFVSATGVDEVHVIDESTLKVVAKIPAGHYPDGIAYAPKARRVFVSDETGNTVAVIDPSSRKLLQKIEMEGEVGNTQYDPVEGLIYSAVQSMNELVSIDPEKMSIVGRFKLHGCEGPHGFYIDSLSHLAIVTGERNASYVVFDLGAKKVIAHGKVGSDPDVLAFDSSLRRLYVASESGVVSSFNVENGSATKLGEVLFAPKAHTVSVDQSTHLVFFPLQNIGGRAVLRVMKPIMKKE